MARYRHVDRSPRLLPVDLEAQLVTGTFAHALHYLLDELDLSAFDAHYRNDETGATAHDPAMLLRAVLLGYSQGLVSSRAIERACRDNVLFVAITGDAKPHFTTIAAFVSRSRNAIATVFAQVLAILGKEGLIGREMFAIDGVKLPSNASKHRSGTRADFLARARLCRSDPPVRGCRHWLDDGGTGAEQELLLPVLEACAEQIDGSTLIAADAGYHCEANLAALSERHIDALIADPGMRRRDERYAGQERHTAKPDPLHDKSAKRRRAKLFARDDFIVAADHSHATCPSGQRLYRNGKDCTVGSYRAIKFRAPIGACSRCNLRAKCLRNPRTTPSRQVALLTRSPKTTHSARMRQRIDSREGRQQYGRHLGIVEPVFGNIRHNKGLNRFTLRGQAKVDGQWKLFALVHNIEKLAKHRHAA